MNKDKNQINNKLLNYRDLNYIKRLNIGATLIKDRGQCSLFQYSK
jgi:hypothetical protein